MQSFEVEILQPKAANLLYDMQEMKLIRLRKQSNLKKVMKRGDENLMEQIELGLKDVARIQTGKTKAKTLKQMLHGK